MDHIAFMSLSPEFQTRATHAYINSHRLVDVDVIYQRPDSIDMPQEFSWTFSDKIEIGLDALILLRMGAEHPDLMPHMLPYIQKLNDPYRRVGRGIDRTVESLDPENFSQDGLLRRTSDLLDSAFLSISSFPTHMEFDFKEAARNENELLPTLQGHARHRHLVENSAVRQLKRAKSFLDHWMDNIQAPLNLAVVSVAPPDNSREAVREVRQTLSERYTEILALH